MPYRLWLLLLLLIAWGISFIQPYDYSDMALEHIPTAGLIVFFLWLEWRNRGRGPGFSNAALTCVFIFLNLHIIGAHYLYSNVPYDDWSRAIFGVSVSEIAGWERNHFDRLVHFLFGVLMLPPMHELVRQFVKPRRGWRMITAIAFLAVFSKMYELLEWGLAETLSPEAAENYNGQQGDMFDAQKDMALALFGSILSAFGIILVSRRAD